MAKERLLFLAWVWDSMYSNRVVGVRIYDVAARKFRDIKEANFIAVAKNNPYLLDNAIYDETAGNLVGTQGDLNDFPVVGINAGPLNEASAHKRLILSVLGNVGFEVIDCMGGVTKIPIAAALQMVSNGLVPNASAIETVEGIQIRSKGKPFETKNIQGKYGSKDTTMGPIIKVGGNRTSLEKDLRQDIGLETEYQDSFNALTPGQRAALVEFYTWHTVDTYASMAKTKRLNVSTDKIAKLAAMRGSNTSWTFGGIIDSYLDSRFDARCGLGHKLRYEFFAVPSEAMEQRNLSYRKMRAMSRTSRRQEYEDMGAIVFGETCASDFFDISKENMAQLVKVRQAMTDEISLMSIIAENNKTAEYKDKHKELTNILIALQTPEKAALIFGGEVAASLYNFVTAGLPFTKSLVLVAADKIRGCKRVFLKELFPGTTDEIWDSIEKEPKFEWTQQLFDFYFEYSIEGGYQYDPVRDTERCRKDKGKYNKETRGERETLEWNLHKRTGIRPREISLATLRELMKSISLKEKFLAKSKDFINSSKVADEYTWNDSLTVADILRTISDGIGRSYRRTTVRPEDIELIGLEPEVFNYGYLLINKFGSKGFGWNYSHGLRIGGPAGYRTGAVTAVHPSEWTEDAMRKALAMGGELIDKTVEALLINGNSDVKYEFRNRIDKDGSDKTFEKLNENVGLTSDGRYLTPELLEQRRKAEEEKRLAEEKAREEALKKAEEEKRFAEEKAKNAENAKKDSCPYDGDMSNDCINCAWGVIHNSHYDYEKHACVERTEAVNITETKQSEPEENKFDEESIKKMSTASVMKELATEFNGREFEDANDYGLKVAKDIVTRYKSADKLSRKQVWRLKDTLKRIKAGELS